MGTFMISVKHVNEILSREGIFSSVPNFVNNRQIKTNLLLAKTSLCIIARGFMDLKELHIAVIAYETKCKQMSRDFLPLNETVINDCLRPINLSMTDNVIQMWCRKCWKYLQYTFLELSKSKKLTYGTI